MKAISQPIFLIFLSTNRLKEPKPGAIGHTMNMLHYLGPLGLFWAVLELIEMPWTKGTGVILRPSLSLVLAPKALNNPQKGLDNPKLGTDRHIYY